MATLLLELFSEEIPSRMQRGAMEQLQRLVAGGFEKAGLTPTEIKTFVSPRHLAIQLFGLPTVQPDVKEEKKGPKVGAPEQAMKGFLNSVGLTEKQCEQRDGYYFAVIERKGRKVAEVAKEICEKALADFVWPKSMRWGDRPMQWVRPLHKITCLLGNEIVPVKFGHLTASNETHGHRFLAPAAINIAAAEDYVTALEKTHVIVDYAERRELIKLEVAKLAQQAKLQLVADENLLDEVTGLIEWPVPLLGTFEKKMLDLPPEVLISEMKVHQRYFALHDSSGKLSNQFIAVANMITPDGGKAVVSGNARVLRARLADGEFYWQQDQKTKLEDWGKKLSDVVFHAKVGMMNHKVARIQALATEIAIATAYKDIEQVQRTAMLAKADLTSGMVGEFPELQGVMGRYYAIAQGEKPEIADAIRDHYKPLGASDTPPESKLASIVAVADKLDSIVSLFAAGEKPTGSKDPFALRRAALGVLKITLHQNWSLDLLTLLEPAVVFSLIHCVTAEIEETKKLDVYNSKGTPQAKFIELQARAKTLGLKAEKIKALDEPEQKLISEIIDFFRDRLKAQLKDDGMRHDIIDAALNIKEAGFNPLAITKRAKELALFTTAKTESLAAIKRILNILAAEEKKNKSPFAFAPAKMKALHEPAEKDLFAAYEKAEAGSLAGLDGLTKPINKFFDDILVNAEDKNVREARLSLLAGVRDHALEIADFSKIEG